MPFSAYAGVCVRYNVVGDTDCQDAEPQQNITVPTPPAAPTVQAPASVPVPMSEQVSGPVSAEAKDDLEAKVDEYIESYGKPPREYVRFNLNPTLENALIWAQKFDEMNKRTQAVSDAWGQAQKILQERKEKGLDLPEYNALSEVPDYTKTADPNSLKWLPPVEYDNTPPVLGFGATETAEAEGAVNLSANTLNEGSIGGAVEAERASQEPVAISYYFSAQCPFCKKFEPEFQSMIKTLSPGTVDVTCVDVTPAGRTEKNIYGKVDCKWRSVISGEMQMMNVTSTPTLIIDRKDSSDLKKVEGLVDVSKLKDFITAGRL